MTTPAFKIDFMKSIGGAVLGTMLVLNPAEADPVVTFQHEAKVGLGGGQLTRQVDCGKLMITTKKQMFMSCAAGKELDPNGQTICTDPSPLPSDDAAISAQGSLNLYMIITHLGSVHGDCQEQAVGAYMKHGGKSADDVRKLMGSVPGIEGFIANIQAGNRPTTSCSVAKLRDQCKAVLGLD